jgi:glycosyltransferase involved in cell wall biosynthesis
MKDNLVSIITPMYNAEKVIEENINSVLKQTYNTWEQIIIDDCSTDKSSLIAKEYSKKYSNIRYIRLNVNKGVSKARNIGIKAANGRYIAFLDSDDFWKTKKLEKQLEFMKNNNSIFTFTAYNIIDQKYNQIKKKINVPLEVNYYKLLKGNVIACSTVIIDRNKILDLKMPDEKHEDFLTWLSILKNNNNALGINEVLTTYRKMEDSISSNKINSAKWTWNIYRNLENLSFLKSVYYFLNYIIHGIRKHY